MTARGIDRDLLRKVGAHLRENAGHLETERCGLGFLDLLLKDTQKGVGKVSRNNLSLVISRRDLMIWSFSGSSG